ILERMWTIKQEIRGHVQKWSAQGVMDRKCAKAAKAAMRASRYIEQNAALFFLNQKGQKLDGLSEDDKTPIFSKGHPWTMSNNERFDYKQDLQSGDVLLWRGTTSISASIARLGDSENNFSHLSIIHIDPKTKRRYNIEALIETGMIMQDFTEEPLHAGSAKVVVFRHKDSEVAKKAAAYAYKIATSTIGTKRHLEYDFGFNLVDHKKVFCSEVVHMAFKKASNGKVMLPQFLTKFDMKNRKFLNDMGTDAKTGFQPGDMELEPSFDMIAEWRNFNYTRSNQLKDIIFSGIYDWMDEYNYQFKWTFKGNVLGTFVFGMRRTPLLRGLVDEKLPLNMPRKTLKNVLTMQKVAGKLYKRMTKILYKKTPNRLYSMADIAKTLEELRKSDLEKYKDQIRANKQGEAYANPYFHHHFGPPKKEVKL
ncbi:MAG: YiiX/YebB-like N1pC/P60 family cysteine hydrolase, partial [Halobacteriovoraceae bacterium]|nr:YiiX/YebB-like N1pC/P60 family cysteine hydrolase [Halobacteriovoraceae bacterium]